MTYGKFIQQNIMQLWKMLIMKTVYQNGNFHFLRKAEHSLITSMLK